MAEPKRSLVLPAILIAAILVGTGVGVYFLYEYNHPKPSAAPWTVEVGSNVTVNYIGYFGSGPQTGKVFDTSLYSVYLNNAGYPKSLEFDHGTSPANYTPIGFSIGPNIPAGGYTIGNETFNGAVSGFWKGLLGLEVGQARTFSFPPSEGYRFPNPTCYATQRLVFSVPVLIPLTTSNFATLYPGVNATPGTHFTDPTYGWDDLVLTVNATAVVVENLPSTGFRVPGLNWPQIVTAVNATTITVTNQLSPLNAGLILGHVPASSAVCGSAKYIISAVNVSGGTYTEDYNSEVTGQTLTFWAMIVAKYG